MFRNTFQSGYLSILFALGTKPLQLWEKRCHSDTAIRRITDEDIKSLVLEILATEPANLSNTYISCPADPQKTLGIKLPFLVLVVKNLNRFFTFEITLMDDKKSKHRFRCSNFQNVTRVTPHICTMPLRLEDGWNTVQLNLADITKRAYGSNYAETMRVQIHGSCRIRRIYFAEKSYQESELPTEFKVFLPSANMPVTPQA